MAEDGQHRHRRDFWITLGIAIAAVSAAVSSFAGLRLLALATGWPRELSWLLPLSVDAYAMTAIRVWLIEGVRSDRVRQYARWNAVGAIVLSLSGNAASHLVAAGLMVVDWRLVLGVGAIPPLVLGLVTHLAVLRGQAVPPALLVDLSPASSRTEVAVPQPSQTELLERARQLDRDHRARRGKPISRDELRRSLHVGGERASALLRQLKLEARQDGATSPSSEDQ